MFNVYRKVLKLKLVCLVENIQIELLIFLLMLCNVFCDVIKVYVMVSKIRDQWINRFVDVLMIKEKGFFVFCEVLWIIGYQFVVDEILGK